MASLDAMAAREAARTVVRLSLAIITRFRLLRVKRD